MLLVLEVCAIQHFRAINSARQTFANLVALAFFGVLANGLLVDKFGQKRTLIASLFVLSAFIFITFFAPNIAVLTAGQVLAGLPWGVFATTAPAYASEVLPLSIRVYLTSYTNMYVYTLQPVWCRGGRPGVLRSRKSF